jgi:hypothetical protein
MRDAEDSKKLLFCIDGKKDFKDALRTLHSPRSAPNAVTSPCTKFSKKADGSSVAKIDSSCGRK